MSDFKNLIIDYYSAPVSLAAQRETMRREVSLKEENVDSATIGVKYFLFLIIISHTSYMHASRQCTQFE